jgi:hypothetical protein
MNVELTPRDFKQVRDLVFVQQWCDVRDWVDNIVDGHTWPRV